MNGEVLPVSRELVFALALGFAVFNEWLLAVFGAALVADDRASLAERMFWISAVLGVAALVVQLVLLTSARVRHWTDGVAGFCVLGLAGWAGVRGARAGIASFVWPMLGANVALVLWAARGWLRRFVVQRDPRRNRDTQNGSSDLTGGRR